MMPLGLWVMLGWMAFVDAIAIGLWIWGRQSGQFSEIEAVKYRVLEDREPAPWPGREESAQ